LLEIIPAKSVISENCSIRPARGMLAGSRLTKALLASRAEDRRRGLIKLHPLSPKIGKTT
jgi:hypothetical protein